MPNNRLDSASVVLASASPRRLDILKTLGISPQVFVPQVEETSQGSPPEIVIYNAQIKAQTAAKNFHHEIVIAADTVVSKDGQVLGKPKDEAEAEKMLAFLSGSAHEVYTAIAVIDTQTGRQNADCSMTKVFFKPLKKESIAAYIASGEPMDKAGAYGIQGLGSVFVERIEGDYGTVVGLSAALLADLVAGLDKRIL
jgi:septum formation protein